MIKNSSASSCFSPLSMSLTLALAFMIINSHKIKTINHFDKNFKFSLFEALPESEIVASAQDFVGRRLPSGSRLSDALELFRAAGASCGRGESAKMGVYYECDYGFHKGFTPILTEWKIIITPSVGEKEIRSIAINRGFTGL